MLLKKAKWKMKCLTVAGEIRVGLIRRILKYGGVNPRICLVSESGKIKSRGRRRT